LKHCLDVRHKLAPDIDVRIEDAKPLGRNFFERGAEAVARDLIGCYLVRKRGQKLIKRRVTETEAYIGPWFSHSDAALRAGHLGAAFEHGQQRLSVKLGRIALEKAGVEFIQADGAKGPGVRLKQAAKRKPKKGGRRGASG
jgi:hypothetical protein